ncbi:SDR family oxidoreductase [Couchioplanes caeruleus]|uniref:Short-chain dehydrogenase n=2 Tax=Couchioplanes caeruleus TaxID=56438 RepID=A0A1K0GJ45_9ACTN|nr:SDR family oxidoreductase [Couchioplanes caeruleus]OJF12286.1 short-chain dehydrogenase [Couchioplanes caeruleus subsp. caeruleus]ROP31473.1 short-subunit dehydrogenase [Couchioplanes caeruleus]
MQISGSVALVTGANRGLGKQFVTSLLDRGAAKVYATARRPELIDVPGVQVLRLDVTDPASIAAAVAAAPDVDLLINNAGIATGQNLITGDLAEIRREMDTHYYGTLGVIRAFAPQLAGGAILNVLSALSWFSYDGAAAYAAAKAAAWSLTNSVRLELARQNTQVTGLHLGAADTDMTARYEGPKISPEQVVTAALDGLEAGRLEVLADDWSRHVKASLAGDPAEFYGSTTAA